MHSSAMCAAAVKMLLASFVRSLGACTLARCEPEGPMLVVVERLSAEMGAGEAAVKIGARGEWLGGVRPACA